MKSGNGGAYHSSGGERWLCTIIHYQYFDVGVVLCANKLKGMVKKQ